MSLTLLSHLLASFSQNDHTSKVKNSHATMSAFLIEPLRLK